MAFKSPAINVRNQGFEKLKQQGEQVIETLIALLDDKNPYVQARAIWLLSQVGEKGNAIVEKTLNDPDEQFVPRHTVLFGSRCRKFCHMQKKWQTILRHL